MLLELLKNNINDYRDSQALTIISIQLEDKSFLYFILHKQNRKLIINNSTMVLTVVNY